MPIGLATGRLLNAEQRKARSPGRGDRKHLPFGMLTYGLDHRCRAMTAPVLQSGSRLGCRSLGRLVMGAVQPPLQEAGKALARILDLPSVQPALHLVGGIAVVAAAA